MNEAVAVVSTVAEVAYDAEAQNFDEHDGIRFTEVGLQTLNDILTCDQKPQAAVRCLSRFNK